MFTTNAWIIYIEITYLRSPTHKDELFMFKIDVSDYTSIFYNLQAKIYLISTGKSISAELTNQEEHNLQLRKRLTFLSL
jgi:hypothetical protein